MTESDQDYYLSWRNQITGPFTMDQIHQQLRRREISTLYKIQVNGNWESLRSYLATHKSNKEKDRLEEAAMQKQRIEREQLELNQLREERDHEIRVADSVKQNQQVTSTPVQSAAAIPIDQEGSKRDDYEEDVQNGSRRSSFSGRGLGIASFVLSLFFFIPVLNLICFILALIFGHLALSQTPSSRRKDENALPWFGVSFTYIQASYLILTVLITSSAMDGYEYSFIKQAIFVALHSSMFINAIVACIFAGLLMLVVHMMANYVPKFYVCYIAALLSVSLTGVLQMLITVGYSGDSTGAMALLIISGLFVMLVNTVIWAVLIRDEKGEPLGYVRALVGSIFCIVMYVVGVFLLIAFVSILN